MPSIYLYTVEQQVVQQIGSVGLPATLQVRTSPDADVQLYDVTEGTKDTLDTVLTLDIKLQAVTDDTTPPTPPIITSTEIFLFAGEIPYVVPVVVPLTPATLQLRTAPDADVQLYDVLEQVNYGEQYLNAVDILVRPVDYYILGTKLIGVSNGGATVTGILRGKGQLVAQSNGVATITGVLTVRPTFGYLTGVINGVASLTGVLQGKGKLVGLINGVASNSGVLVGKGKLVGVITGVASLTGVLKGKGQLVGLINGVASSTGVLKGKGKLVGLTNGVAIVTGILAEQVVAGAVQGESNGVAIVTGRLVIKYAHGEVIECSSPITLFIDQTSLIKSQISEGSLVTVLINENSLITQSVDKGSTIKAVIEEPSLIE